MSDQRYKGRAYARGLSSSEVGMCADALVLGGFDWRDWFGHWDRKPSKEFMRGFTDEVMARDQNDGCSNSTGIEYDADHGGYY